MLPANASPIARITLADVGRETMVVTSATVTIAPATLKTLSPMTAYFPTAFAGAFAGNERLGAAFFAGVAFAGEE
jgi:hypothetical protein